jgi:hypothetical protein
LTVGNLPTQGDDAKIDEVVPMNVLLEIPLLDGTHVVTR